MGYVDIVEKSIDKRIDEFKNIVENGNDFDSSIASLVVAVLLDLKEEVVPE